MGITSHTTSSWVTCTQVKKQQSEPDIEQWTGSKLRKEYVKAIYCHPAYLTGCMYAYVWCIHTWCICRVHHAKCQAGWLTSWNQDCWEKHQQPQIHRWYHSNGRNWKGTKEPIMRAKRDEKANLKLNIKKTKIMTPSLITSRQINGEKMVTVTIFSWAPKSLWMVIEPWN